MVADTCVAMDEWVQHPTARTALDDILPCVDNATAQQTLIQSQNVTYQLAVVVNTMITKIANANVPPTPRLPIYYNQSGPLMPVLCNPFYSNLTKRQCATGEVELSKAPEVIPLTLSIGILVWKCVSIHVKDFGHHGKPGLNKFCTVSYF